MEKEQKTESPCTGDCRLDPTLKYCLGCWRDIEAIMKWTFLSPAQQDLAMRRRKRNKFKHLDNLLDDSESKEP